MLNINKYAVAEARDPEPPKPTEPYDKLFPVLMDALRGRDTITWDTVIAGAVSELPPGSSAAEDIPPGADLDLSIPVHEELRTLFQLAHHTTLTLTGERI